MRKSLRVFVVLALLSGAVNVLTVAPSAYGCGQWPTPCDPTPAPAINPGGSGSKGGEPVVAPHGVTDWASFFAGVLLQGILS